MGVAVGLARQGPETGGECGVTGNGRGCPGWRGQKRGTEEAVERRLGQAAWGVGPVPAEVGSAGLLPAEPGCGVGWI